MNIILPKRKASKFLLFLAIPSLILPAMVLAQNTVSAHPGTLNYVEGQVSIEGHQLTTSSVGQTSLAAGQYLATPTAR